MSPVALGVLGVSFKLVPYQIGTDRRYAVKTAQDCPRLPTLPLKGKALTWPEAQVSNSATSLGNPG